MAREQRRLAAVFAADVFGYSRLMGRDESGTLERLKTHRGERLVPALARNAGRLVKTTGDGFLAEFASAVDALRAAVEFQQAVSDAGRDEAEDQRIVFRVGLHLGDLIVDDDDLYGDGVNIAARLEGAAPPGGILVSAALAEAVEGRLKADLTPLGELALKNIERPVRAFRVDWKPDDWPVTASDGVTLGATRAFSDKPSIAVLPFANMSGDADQEYFADGVSEDIISALSRFRELMVISRGSSFAFKGKGLDVRQIASQLGVRYLLSGSLRKAGNRLRLSAEITDASSGTPIWSDRYDRELADVFELQDDISRAVAGVIEPAIRSAESSAPAASHRRASPPTISTCGRCRIWRTSRETASRKRSISCVSLWRSSAIAHRHSRLSRWLWGGRGRLARRLRPTWHSNRWRLRGVPSSWTRRMPSRRRSAG
ncbi:MAG TPA: adenylate/guanylate cyclase domain-containing protein [Reyranellaceae bacterium]|nr:adenylate/guanylate cyclase domain-containing protein [Reyranellaceae bacterium]